MLWLFRVDAGKELGIGHLQRCLSLARALEEKGHSSVFVCNDNDVNNKRVSEAGFEIAFIVHPSWSIADADQTAAIAQQRGAVAIVVDSDLEGDAYWRRLRGLELLTVAVEDMVKHDYPVSVLINGDVHGADLDYACDSDTVRLLGPQYAILNPDYWDLEQFPKSESVERILLTTGGGDQHQLMPMLVRTVAEAAPTALLEVIIGPFFDQVDAIALAARSYGDRIRLIRAPDGLRPYVATADLAVTAGGQTLYEMARLGCPAVAFTVVDNQEMQTQAFADAGSLIHAGCAGSKEFSLTVGNAVNELVADPRLRRSLGDAGSAMIDGQGARRLAVTLIGLCRSAEGTVASG